MSSNPSVHNNPQVMHVLHLPPELVRQAQLLVCGQAIDVEDALMLFDVLNLKGAETKELYVTGAIHSSSLDDAP